MVAKRSAEDAPPIPDPKPQGTTRKSKAKAAKKAAKKAAPKKKGAKKAAKKTTTKFRSAKGIVRMKSSELIETISGKGKTRTTKKLTIKKTFLGFKVPVKKKQVRGLSKKRK